MWETAKLGEICNFEGGSQPPKKEFLYEPTDGYVRFLQIRDFKSNKNITYIPIAKKNRLCSEDDILIGRYVASVGQILVGLSGAYNVALMKTIPNEEYISKGWLHAYLTSPLFQKPLMEVSSRSAQNGFSKDDIYDFDVPLPPIAEQQRIVAKLDTAFAEIDEAIGSAKTKENKLVKVRDSLISNFFSDERVEYNTAILSSVIEKSETINPSSVFPNDEFEYVDVSSVNRNSLQIEETQTLLGAKAPSRARRLIKKDDVIFATVRPTLKRVAIVPAELDRQVCSTGYIVLRPKPETILSSYLFYFLISEKVMFEMKKLQSGASYPAVSDTQVKSLCISYPSLTEQQLIVDKLDSAFVEIELVDKTIKKKQANYQALKSAILAQELQSEAA